MSPRKNRIGTKRGGGDGRPSPPPRDDDALSSALAFGLDHTEEAPDGEWVVRQVPAARAVKPYRCPGCDHEIAPGVGHVVAWPADPQGVQERRHWHRPCWRARLSRRPRWNR